MEVNTEPDYQQVHIDEADKRGKLHLIISPRWRENFIDQTRH